MQEKDQVIIFIIAAIAVLLFIGILFLVMIWAYNAKKQQMERDKKQIQDNFDKQLLEARLEIQEETFNAISEEIHDNVGQMLSLAKVQLNIIARQPGMPLDALSEVKETVGSALADLRNIAKSLSSGRIHARSLGDSIREEVTRLQKSKIDIAFHTEGEERATDKQVKLILFRIIQESLQNILKHARATKVEIDFRCLADKMEIRIADNGVGFHVEEQLQQVNGLGLQNILNRAALIGGQARISSSINEGTTTTILVPYA
ncbi:sensor histidine kinase [Chitinophaga lutea]